MNLKRIFGLRFTILRLGKGFTLIEMLVIIGIIVILMILAIPTYRSFQKESDLNNSAEEIINTLRLAQNKTLASEGASQYGVYFDQTVSPHQYTLFKGTDYALRDSSFDKIHKLPKSIEIFEVDLNGGGAEIIFDRISGTTSQFGNLTIRLKDDITKERTIYIENSGQIGLTSPSVPSDTERIKDSRHVHFNYNQDVTTAITLHLIFPVYTADNYDIDFQTYLSGDEFSWEGTVLVGPDGSKTEQKLKIHTHNIDGFTGEASFCVHRNRDYNDRTLEITLDDQNLINYTADGQTTQGTSVFVTAPVWQ